MNNNWIKGTGKLIYNPERPGMRKSRQHDEWFLAVNVDPQIAEYYRWWVYKRFMLQLQHTAWHPHVTVLDGRRSVKPQNRKNWEKHSGEIIHFEYSPNIEQHWKFWCLPVKSERLQEIKRELGFNDAESKLHVTIGRML